MSTASQEIIKLVGYAKSPNYIFSYNTGTLDGETFISLHYVTYNKGHYNQNLYGSDAKEFLELFNK